MISIVFKVVQTLYENLFFKEFHNKSQKSVLALVPPETIEPTLMFW